MATSIKLRRRILIEAYTLLLNYPAGVIAMIAGAEPQKAQRYLQRIATRIWEKAEAYNDRASKVDEVRNKLLKSFTGREENIREMYAEKVALRPTDERWKKEQELLQESALGDLNDAKDEALWKGGHFRMLWEHLQVDGMEYDDVELSKDLKDMFVKCFAAYVADRFVLEDEPDEKEKEKKRLKKPRFVIQRRSGPFGGTQEIPIAISGAAEAEIEYALGEFSDEEEKDAKLRIEQTWSGDRKQTERRMKELEEKYGPGGEAPPLV